MVREAQAYAEEDSKRRELAGARNTADSATYAAEQSLNDLGDNADATAKAEVEAKIQVLRNQVDAEDAEALRQATAELQQALQALSAAAYAQQAEAAEAAAPSAEAAADTEDGAGDSDTSDTDDNAGDELIEGDHTEAE